ncbi:MAG: hypothetical protein ACM3RX_10020 [Methanococcaceae archaeon]
MKICTKCNLEYTNDKKFCKACGSELTESQVAISETPKDKTYIYLGFIALLVPISTLIWKIHQKIFVMAFNHDFAKMYESMEFRISTVFIFLIYYSVPVLIALKIKNNPLKLFIISLTGIVFILEGLGQVSRTLNWNTFWFN